MDEDAQVGMISTILLLGVAVLIFSTIMLYYVPIWIRDTESGHMDLVAGQFSSLHNTLNNVNETSISSVPISLGTGGIPMVGFGKTSGTLNIIPVDPSMCINSIENNLSLSAGGCIVYIPSSKFFVPQTYQYSNGALLLIQGDRAILKFGPDWDFEVIDETLLVRLSLITISGSNSIGGSDEVQINILQQDMFMNQLYIPGYPETGTIILEIDTLYPEAWSDYIGETLRGRDIPENYYKLEPQSDMVRLVLNQVNLADSSVSKVSYLVSIGIG